MQEKAQTGNCLGFLILQYFNCYILILLSYKNIRMKFFDTNGTEIKTDKLPRLVVVTGLNGSGKTRGLKHLRGNDSVGAQYIDYRNFSARWDSSTFADSNPQGGMILSDMIKDWSFPTQGTLFGNMSVYWGYGSDESQKLEWLKQNRNVATANFARLAWPFFDIFPEAQSSPFYTHKDLLSRHPDKAEIYWRGFEDGTVPSVYKNASKKSGQPAHCLTEQQLIDTLDRLQRLQFPLSLDLSKLITDYVEKRNKFLYESWINKGISLHTALQAFRQENPDPLTYINQILERLADNEADVFQFSVRSTIPEIPPTYEKLKQLPVTSVISLQDAKTGAMRDMNELSSGEQALLALATLVYTHTYIQSLPALYLDEIDASLHPSMIQAMLEILHEQSGDTRIYLATHSPSTVALAPEKSLFFVSEGQAKKINRAEAIEGLTQGFFTTEGISSVFRSLRGINQKIIVISEGDNYQYLQAIFDKVGIANQFHIHPYKLKKSGGRGVSELKVLYKLFIELIDTLPNGKKFVFLLDCEQAKEADWVNKDSHPIVKSLTLKEIEVNPVRRGIENVVPDILLSELEDEHGVSMWGSQKDPNKGIKYKGYVKEKFLRELILPNSRIDIETLKHTLSDLIALVPDNNHTK